MGFIIKSQTLHAVVKQAFVKADALTNLDTAQAFLTNNGFTNSRNHDYYHSEMGLFLVDLHDENVFTQHNILYFIYTVFYINPPVFWE